MQLLTSVTAIVDFFLPGWAVRHVKAREPVHESLASATNAAQKPGQQAWLVARAVSLRAF